MRWAGVALVGLVGAAAAAPYVNGYLVEQELQKAIAEADGHQGMSLQVSEYERGYLQASVAIRLQIKDVTGDRPDLALEVRGIVDHRLTGASFEGDVQPLDSLADMVLPLLDGKPMLTAQADWSLFGTLRGAFSSPAIVMSEDVKVNVSPAELAFAGDVYKRHMELDLKWDGMQIDDTIRANRFTIGKLQMHQKGEQLSPYLWVGDSTVELQRIEGIENDRSLVLENIRLTSGSEKSDAERMRAHLDIEIEKTIVNGQTLEPHVLKFSLEDLAISEFDALMRSIDRLQQMDASMDEVAQAEAQMQRVQEMLGLASSLLGKGMGLHIHELKVHTTQGPITGQLHVKQPGQSADDGMLMASTSGTLELNAPTALFANAPEDMQQQLQVLLAEGLVVEKDGFYGNKSKLENMMLDVNGLQIPLPPLF